MIGIMSEIVYFTVVNNIAPIMVSSLNDMYMSYVSGRRTDIGTTTTLSDVDDEQELEQLQMERLLKWMGLIFEDSTVVPVTPILYTGTTTLPVNDTRKAYKKDLYNIYVTIASDFRQYQTYKKYYANIWLFSMFRNKNTRDLVRKILSDVKLYYKCLRMLILFEHLQH